MADNNLVLEPTLPEISTNISGPSQNSNDQIISQLSININELNSAISESILNSKDQITNQLSTNSNELNSTISESTNLIINSIESNLAHPDDPTFLTTIGTLLIGALIAGIVAFIFNLLHWRVIRKRERLSSISNMISAKLKDLEKVTVRYWISGYDANYKAETLQNEIEIKSGLFIVVNSLMTFLDDDENKICDKEKKELIQLNDNLFEVATGGQFESVNRVPNKKAANVITRQINRMLIIICKNIY